MLPSALIMAASAGVGLSFSVCRSDLRLPKKQRGGNFNQSRHKEFPKAQILRTQQNPRENCEVEGLKQRPSRAEPGKGFSEVRSADR